MQVLNIYSCEFLTTSDGVIDIGIWFQGTYGECDLDEAYGVGDQGYVAGARSALLISMMCGFAAGTMVLFEWVCCEICCAGCLEGLAFVGAWACGL